MKYCPKCGQPLNDDALFCSKCGTKQPVMEPVKEEPAPVVEPKPVVEPAPIREEPKVVEVHEEPSPIKEERVDKVEAAPNSETPAAKFNRLMKEDKVFKTAFQNKKFIGLVGLVRLLLVVILIVYLVTPCILITGINISDQGRFFLDAEGISSLPASINIFVANQFKTGINAVGKAFSPSSSFDSSLAVKSTLFIIFTPLFCAVIILAGILPTTKGSFLKEYEKDRNACVKTSSSVQVGQIVLGVILHAYLPLTALFTHIALSDLKYSGGSTYYLGELASDTRCLAATTVTAIICLTVYLAATIVSSILFKKRMNRVLNQE